MVMHSDSGADELREIPIAAIQRRPQVRTEFEPGSLEELAASFKAVGQQQPILVRDEGDTFRLIYGDRRVQAAMLIGWTKIRAVVTHADLTESEILQRQIIENIQRVDLNPVDKAKGVQQLMEMDGLKAGVVATRLGTSAGSITKMLKVLTLPAAIQEQVASGKIPPSAAYELSRIGSDTEQQQLADDLVAGKLNRDGLAKAIKDRAKPATAEKSSTVSSRATASLPGGRTVTVVGPALDLETFIAVLEELLGHARKERNKGIGLSTFVAMLRDQSLKSTLVEA